MAVKETHLKLETTTLRGPRGGVRVGTPDGGRIELGIYRRGVPPRFEMFFYDADGDPQLPPIGVSVEVKRPDGRKEIYRFARYGNSLESTADVPGPYDFDLRLSVPREGNILVHSLHFGRHSVPHETQDLGSSEEAAASKPEAPISLRERVLSRVPPFLRRRFTRAAERTVAGRVSSLLLSAAREEPRDVMAALETAPEGLRADEVERRIELFGPNEVGQESKHGWTERLLSAVRNPLVILLTALGAVSFATGDPRAGTVMMLMVFIAVCLRFVQETRADNAAAKLRAMIRVTATVIRGGKPIELPLHELVPGDVINLSAGDMIPADVRLVSAKDLFVTQASLTGESLPVEKTDAPDRRENISPLELSNVGFLGTSVESGTATAVIAATGPRSYLGSIAQGMAAVQPQTSFDKGINRFTWLMIKFMAVMVPLVFFITGFTKHDWKDAFFFALAVAVGLTPEMLPMIVSVSLSKGALLLSRKKVIVKKLSAIQNFGAMDVLCTDKTGTLTLDHVVLEKHCDVVRAESEEVLRDAYLISHFQTGLRNILDRAILAHREVHQGLSIEKYAKVDEIPFDFVRRMMSVVVRTPEGQNRLLAKGAPEEIYRRCTRFELDGEVSPMEQIVLDDLRKEYELLSSEGFRVLAVAYRDVPEQAAYSKADESDLVLTGYVAFLDPPKESAAAAISALHKHGVAVKVLTGDNDLVARKVCSEVGLDTAHVLLGADVEQMDDEQLAEAAETTTLFARLSPAHKQRIVKALQGRNHVVGFMGDGINDAPALRAADVGISVDTAVDIAKESADLILLEKDLMVLEQGVLEGRKVFANILKYIRMGASSNFGNMFSVLGASARLPFLPMAPIQILANNMLYDMSQIPIPTDAVDEEQVSRPRPWNIAEITRFILFIGPISSIFDYTTFFVMWYIFKCNIPAMASLFQSGWFVESLMTQTLIIHVIRTNKIPFIQSRASWPLTVTSLVIMAIGGWLPFSPLASSLGLTRLPILYWPILLATLFCYVALTQLVKMWLLRKRWI
jgi:Mg2+-importing ATPase